MISDNPFLKEALAWAWSAGEVAEQSKLPSGDSVVTIAAISSAVLMEDSDCCSGSELGVDVLTISVVVEPEPSSASSWSGAVLVAAVGGTVVDIVAGTESVAGAAGASVASNKSEMLHLRINSRMVIMLLARLQGVLECQDWCWMLLG